jgi:hypothetical protein
MRVSPLAMVWSRFIRKYFPVGLFLAPILISSIYLVGQNSGTIPREPVPKEEGAALLTGGRVSYWEDGRHYCTLEMGQIELVPKRWGLFRWVDSRDIIIKDCRLKVDNAALSSSLEGIGLDFLHLARIGSAAGQSEENSHGSGAKAAPGLTPICLPPKVEASPFLGEILHPQGQKLILKADVVIFDPPHSFFSLEGNAQVISSDGTWLEAESLDWDPAGQQVWVTGTHKFHSQNRLSQGRDGHFGLAEGLIKPLPHKKERPPVTAASPFPVNPLEQTLTAKAMKGGNNAILPLLGLAMIQTQAGNSAGSGGKAPQPVSPPSSP